MTTAIIIIAVWIVSAALTLLMAARKYGQINVEDVKLAMYFGPVLVLCMPLDAISEWHHSIRFKVLWKRKS